MTYNALRKGRVSEPGREFLVTAVTCNRQRLFERFELARLTIKELRALEDSGVIRALAWVLMPDHLHCLLSLGKAASLSAGMQHFKGRSARAINACRGSQGRVWQPGFHDRGLRREEDRVAIARYIVANPLRAGLVARIEDYPHWDSVWLEP